MQPDNKDKAKCVELRDRFDKLQMDIAELRKSPGNDALISAKQKESVVLAWHEAFRQLRTAPIFGARILSASGGNARKTGVVGGGGALACSDPACAAISVSFREWSKRASGMSAEFPHIATSQDRSAQTPIFGIAGSHR